MSIAVAVKHMLAAGMAPDAIVAAVEEMEASAAPVRSAGAIRTARWRTNRGLSQASQNVTCDASDVPLSPKKERSPTPPKEKTTPIPETSLRSVSARKTGSRISDDWQPDRVAAREIGIPESRIDGIAARFKDFWRAKPGAGGVKLDWLATWRNWCRSEAEKNGWQPIATTQIMQAAQPPPGMIFIEYDSREWEDRRRSGDKMPPPTRTVNGKQGAYFPTQLSQQGEAA